MEAADNETQPQNKQGEVALERERRLKERLPAVRHSGFSVSTRAELVNVLSSPRIAETGGYGC